MLVCPSMPCRLHQGSTFPRDRAGPVPTLLFRFPQGLCLCQNRRPHCADDLLVPLHPAEKVARGYMGRWGDCPAFGGVERQASQPGHRAFLWQGEGSAGAPWEEPHPWPASISFRAPFPLLHPSELPPQSPRVPSCHVPQCRALMKTGPGSFPLASRCQGGG